MANLSQQDFVEAARGGGAQTTCIPLVETLLADQVTPVLAYRRLVSRDPRTAPSFLFESVEGGERQGRYSIMGAQPSLRVRASATRVQVDDLRTGRTEQRDEPDPLAFLRSLAAGYRLCRAGPGLPGVMLGGWVGYAAYDAARYDEPKKLAFDRAPRDDRNLPDLEFALYDGVVILDHARQVVHVVTLGMVPPGAHREEIEAAYDAAGARLSSRVVDLQTHSRPLPLGRLGGLPGPGPSASNLTRAQHAAIVERAKEYIRAGDVFQVVLGQRFERRSAADPFDVYRALRAVNPSPYMVYMQTSGCILVASSPEILCRVRSRAGTLEVTNRPLAGTRRRGGSPAEDQALEADLLADPKERSEHVMLVDLGRNDVGRVARPGSVRLPNVMEVERYSHVMHISSTVTGELREGLDCWDALRAALPVGTISGAPKVRAMQIIDELEPVRRGPYGGGMGYVSLEGEMDIALTLRTMVVPHEGRAADAWIYHLQASGGIVAGSEVNAEYEETVNKAAALARAIDVAEAAWQTL